MNKATLITTLITLIPLASAQSFQIENIFQEPWIMFIILFAVFFAFIYAVLQKTQLKHNLGAVAIISLAISFLATTGIFRDEFIPGLSIITAFIIAAVLGIGLFLVVTFGKAAYFNLGFGGVFLIIGLFSVSSIVKPF